MASILKFNRRLTQTFADSFFSLLDWSKEKLHALRANSFVSLFGDNS
jgi:hypothetical protein